MAYSTYMFRDYHRFRDMPFVDTPSQPRWRTFKPILVLLSILFTLILLGRNCSYVLYSSVLLALWAIFVALVSQVPLADPIIRSDRLPTYNISWGQVGLQTRQVNYKPILALLSILSPLILLWPILASVTQVTQVVQANWRLCLCSLSDHLLRSPGYSFFYDEIYMVFVDTIVQKGVMAIFIAVVMQMILLSFKIYFIRTGQTKGVLPAFVTLWVSTVNLLLIDQILSFFCDQNSYSPFRKVPIHLLSLSINICLTILLLPLHMPQFASVQVVLIENLVKMMMAMSLAVVAFGYIMVIMLVIGYRSWWN